MKCVKVCEEGAIKAHVQPTLFAAGALEAAVPMNFNLITLEGSASGRQSLYGQGAGRYPTAYNVLQDCVDIRNGLRNFYNNRFVPRPVDNGSVLRSYYVRTDHMDKWLQKNVDRIMDYGLITKPVSVAEIHHWAKEQDCFIASLRD
jgi:homoserine dehydrogenase